MADLDAADLLARLKATLQRPTTDDATTDAQLYTLLSNAQRKVLQMMAAHVPWVNYAAPEKLTTADSGATYTFAYYPLGHAEIRESRTGALLQPVPEWSNLWGYVQEGQTIRWPNGQTRTFADGPYARYCREPDVISGSVAPILKPDYARLGIVYEAAADWAMQGGLRDPSAYLLQAQRFLWGDANTPGHLGLIPSLKQQYAFQGGQIPDSGRWWISPDFR